MRFGVLGPLVVDVGSDTTQMRVGMQQRLLAFLVAAGGRPISVSGIVVTLWPFEKPSNASKTVHIYVHRLRKMLRDPDRVTYGPGGYALAIDESEVDYLEFERDLKLARRKREAGSAGEAMAKYEAALGYWRGEPYADIDDRGVLRVEIERLNILKSDAAFEYAELCVERGKHKSAIPSLTELLTFQPHHEGLYRLLMIAYYRSGHPTKALDTYRQARTRISGELGIDLADDIENLHRSILNRDPELETPVLASLPRPRQLPSAPEALFGRDAELEALSQARSRSGTAAISVIHGMVGAGKTALAVHAGQRLAGKYPHGQIFADLHGFTQDAKPKSPGDVLGSLLRSLGVADHDIPSDTDARASVWRSLLHDKKMLVVLDNAADAKQVLPLLPGKADCHVIVTSRTSLAELDGRVAFRLNAISAGEAARLFTHLVGPRRVEQDPVEELTRVVDLCAGSPLALRMAAVRFRDRPTWRLRDLADRLERADRLAELDIGAHGLHGRYEVSFRRLDAEGRRLIECLGSSFREDFDAGQVAEHFGVEVAETERALEKLVDTSMLMTTRAGGYRVHELMLAYMDSQESG